MFIRCFALVFVVSLFTACVSSPEPPSEPLRLRVLTYNIHHGEGTDGVFDLQRLADVIKRAKPDLVALQEVDVKTKRSGGVDQAAKLGELTGMHHYFAQAMPFQGGGYGVAVLSRAELISYRDVDLDAASGQETRSAAVVDTTPWGAAPTINFSSTHLCHQSEQTRTSQVNQLIRSQSWPMAPAVLAGDFNCPPGSRPYDALINAGWFDAATAFGDPKPAHPATNPHIRIDHVFLRPIEKWRVIDMQVLDEPIASDHCPVLVELEYLGPASPLGTKRQTVRPVGTAPKAQPAAHRFGPTSPAKLVP